MVLSELYCAPIDKKTGCKMLRRTALAECCNWNDNYTFRRVLQQLRSSKYIATMGFWVALTCDPSELSVYELFEVLHGGIPLGEDAEQEHTDNYYADDKYHKIKRLEADVAAVSRKYFERRAVVSMISKRPSYRKRNVE